MSGIKDRLLEFLDHLKVGQSNFEKDIGLSNGLINNLSDNISSKSLIKIIRKHPELNLVWLLTGEEQMLTGHLKKNGEVGEELSDLIDKDISKEAAINVLIETIAALSGSEKGMEAALISGQLRQAVKIEEERLRGEYAKKQ